MRTPRTRFPISYSNRVLDGVQHLYMLSNGLQVSVVSHQYSYGGKSGLWEACAENGSPQGWLTDEGLADYLIELSEVSA